MFERFQFVLQAAVVPVLLVLVLIIGVSPAVAAPAENDPGGSVQAQYASASSSADAQPVVVTRDPGHSRGTLGSLPEAFTLITVGGMLLGLAAAVRKTTT